MARQAKALPALEWLQPRVRLTRALSLFSFFALFILLLVWDLAFADLHGARTWVVVAIQVGPLLLVAPGLLLGHTRTFAWTCFLMNLYFIQGILAAIDPARMLVGLLQTIISFSLFCSALLHVRWRFQQDRKLAGE